jgi:hypothetical protein
MLIWATKDPLSRVFPLLSTHGMEESLRLAVECREMMERTAPVRLSEVEKCTTFDDRTLSLYVWSSLLSYYILQESREAATLHYNEWLWRSVGQPKGLAPVQPGASDVPPKSPRKASQVSNAEPPDPDKALRALLDFIRFSAHRSRQRTSSRPIMPSSSLPSKCPTPRAWP